MVLKTELCRFSGEKIYPGKGIRFIRSDSQVFLFANSKCNRYFHNRLKPSKLTWTAMYRKQHKKDIAAESVKKKRRSTKKPYSRSIVGATLEVIQNRRTEKPEVRDAAREAALREIKERIKKTKDEKKALRVSPRETCPRLLLLRSPSSEVVVESDEFSSSSYLNRLLYFLFCSDTSSLFWFAVFVWIDIGIFGHYNFGSS